MADNTDLRDGRGDLPYFDNQLDAVTESDGAGGWQLKTGVTVSIAGGATAANQATQIAIANDIDNNAAIVAASVFTDPAFGSNTMRTGIGTVYGRKLVYTDVALGATLSLLGAPIFTVLIVAQSTGLPIQVNTAFTTNTLNPIEKMCVETMGRTQTFNNQFIPSDQNVQFYNNTFNNFTVALVACRVIYYVI